VFTPGWFHDLTARQRSFSSLAALESWNGNTSAVFDLPSSQGAERLRGAFATTNFFSTIGVSAVAGRTFAPDDPADVAILSHELWQSVFGGADAVGRRLELATGRGKERTLRAVTIIGVLPPRVQFTYPESTDVWLPLTPQQLHNPRLQGAVLVLFVASLNVAALLLAQIFERRRAFAVQLALGASRWRVMRQLLTESSLMAILAAAFSVACVAVLQPLLRATIPGSMPRVDEIGIDLVTIG